MSDGEGDAVAESNPMRWVVLGVIAAALFAVAIVTLVQSKVATAKAEAAAAAQASEARIARADEVAAGAVNHALRFILPNPYMRQAAYVHPASHAGSPSSKDPNAPPYGVRFRLKASFDDSSYDAGEKGSSRR